ncbi:MAG: hypothetical protein KHW87_01000 [Clostridiales bacterium]|nr:hypothetical protein [Clostridiales bacterium]
MAILNAIIENKGNTLIIDFPHSIYDVYEKLLSIGIRKSPNDIMLTDNEDDDIQVKLYSDSDFGNHVIRLLGEDNSLADANTTAYLLMTADDEFKDELEQNILYDQYDFIRELTADLKNMKDMLGQVKISFFCLLEGNIQDSEYGEMQPAGNWYLKSYEWEIRELLEMEQSSPEDEMAQFFNEDEIVKAKLVSAVWTVDEYKGKLYGKINCRFKEQLTEDETEIFKNWLVGQCSDGFGEHFEQQSIQTEDGELFVSFWNSSDGYFLCTEDKLESCIENSQGLQMGGM